MVSVRCPNMCVALTYPPATDVARSLVSGMRSPGCLATPGIADRSDDQGQGLTHLIQRRDRTAANAALVRPCLRHPAEQTWRISTHVRKHVETAATFRTECSLQSTVRDAPLVLEWLCTRECGPRGGSCPSFPRRSEESNTMKA